jgi:general secretion pathway protein D
MVIPDQAQKRRDYEEELLKTFYLANTVTPQDLTEIVTGLRQLFDLKRIQQLNARNAIVVRATPDVLTLVGKVIDDIDTARPEVVIQVEILEARTDRLRNLGISPSQTASIAINPNASATSSTATGTTTPNTTLNTLTHLNSNDYQVTLPNFTANAILTDTSTRIIQDPELRSIDGQEAKLKVGDRIPNRHGKLPGGRWCRRGGFGRVSKSPRQHAVSISRCRREYRHHATRSSEPRDQPENEDRSFLSHQRTAHRRHHRTRHQSTSGRA